MIKAYSYIRFSSAEQAKGDSLRRQLEKARQWCEMKGEVVLDDTLRDLGKSAYRGKNAEFGELRRFLDFVKDGTVPAGSYLLVESLDRLSRQTVVEAFPRLLELIQAGITVVTLADKHEYSKEGLNADWTPLMFSLMEMARAHEESRLKGHRVGIAWAEKRTLALQTGQAMTAIAPAWVELVGGPKTGRYELIDDRAMLVKRIFAETIAGFGRRAIANKLNVEQVETWGRAGKKGVRWHDSYIQKILGNPATFGRFEPLSKLAGGAGSGAEPIEGYFPPVIDEATFYRAKAASGSRHTGQGRPSETHRNILRGLAKCHNCGSNLIIIDKGKRSRGPKLICGSAHASSGCAERSYYQYWKVELFTFGAVSDRLDALVLSSRDRAAHVAGQRQAQVTKIEELKARLANLIELVETGGDTSTAVARTKELQRLIDEHESLLSKVEVESKVKGALVGRDAAATFMELQAQLRHAQPDEQPSIRAAISQRLRGFVDRIIVEPTGGRVILIDGGEGAFFGNMLTATV